VADIATRWSTTSPWAPPARALPEGDVRLSETTLRIRDEERQDLIEEARRAAQKLILAHRELLDELAEELLEGEVLERDAIDRIMKGVPRLERAPGVGLRVVAATEAPRLPPPAPFPGVGPAARTAAHGYRLRRSVQPHRPLGVAVEEIDPAMEIYRDGFQLQVAHREVVQEQGVEAVLLDVGEGHVELLAPLSPDTPVGRFLAKQGPGLHHVATR